MSQTRIRLFDAARAHQAQAAEIEEAAIRVLRSGSYILGEEVARFEAEFAARIGTRFALGVSSGTDALVLSLRALGISRGDEVITTAYSFVATASAVSSVGATPVFVDIDPATGNIDPDGLEAALTENSRALLVVHLFGHPAQMEHIKDFCKRHDLRLIEDCAQAHGATYQGKATGTFSDVGAFSFFPSKNLGAAGDGGAVVTNSEELYHLMRALRRHGQISPYIHGKLGGNWRLDELQAAILRVKLQSLDAHNQARRSHAAYYRDVLGDLDGLQLPVENKDCTHVYHQYVIRAEDRDTLQARLDESGIDTAIYYPRTLAAQPLFGEEQGFGAAETLSRQALAIPVHPFLRESELEYVAKSISSARRRLAK